MAVTDGLLYRRGSFNGSWNQLLCNALVDVQGAQIAFSPGFCWGTTLLPGQAITRELRMDQVAITNPHTTVSKMTGEFIKTVLEDVADNLFNADSSYQQGGDMVRVGGLQYSITPGKKMGARISDMRPGARPSRPARPTRWRAERRRPRKHAAQATNPCGTCWRLGSRPRQAAASSRGASTRPGSSAPRATPGWHSP